ncbi:efflux RND transporter periplasmic adaptor subunit [Aquimarina litoralis]|uniref:efflux RND transporter periplasmic adaptor subunit n=1 Tax=Aquimarina litoralis TaxID=584605 RepID=UPI001C569377|nr:efflux RND transporter periplasmic adaptor subunit [Aquimarina litoralis]MBW1295493.1 efflux RND transporter periplasmic adaptor subunit [Aquimarina litoralis]
MKKKSAAYIVIALLAGIGIGYFLFGETIRKESDHSHVKDLEQSEEVWTCSMHPHIRLSEPGDCPICGMDLIASTDLTNDLETDQFKMTENAMALANVQTSIVGDIGFDTEEIKLTGKIEENEETTTVQVTHFKGRIERLLVNSVGEKISKGQTIALIYSPELVAAQQELLTASKVKKQQPDLYNAVRNKLKIRKLSENQINQIESSGTIMETFPIHSHVSGIVSEKMVEEGNHIERGQILYKISDLKTVWAQFDVYENQISSIRKGQEISIVTNAYPDNKIAAKISFVDPILNATSRIARARAELMNKGSLFKPGMFVEGTISIADKDPEKKTIMVPKSAVLWTGKRSVVYVKEKASTPIFEMREVTLGNSNNNSYEILSGLNAGEEIVTNGTFTVDAAAQLQGKKSMMKLANHQSSSPNNQQFKNTKASIDFKRVFNDILPVYFDLKDALVASDSKLAVVSSKKMLTYLQTYNAKELQEREIAYVQKTIQNLEGISSREDLINQRIHFKSLNENLEAIIREIGNASETIYIQKCPMADDNNGAIWLSKEKEIKNPYFGDEMLACGSVISTLEKL